MEEQASQYSKEQLLNRSSIKNKLAPFKQQKCEHADAFERHIMNTNPTSILNNITHLLQNKLLPWIEAEMCANDVIEKE